MSISVNSHSNLAKYVKYNSVGLDNIAINSHGSKRLNNVEGEVVKQGKIGDLKIVLYETEILLENIKKADTMVNMVHKIFIALGRPLAEQQQIAKNVINNHIVSMNTDIKTIIYNATRYNLLKVEVRDIAYTRYGDMSLKVNDQLNLQIMKDRFLKLRFRAILELNSNDFMKLTVISSKQAKTSLPNVESLIEYTHHSLCEILSAKNRLENAAKLNSLKAYLVKVSYSSIKDTDITEYFKQFVEYISKMNNAMFADLHSNNILRELVLILTK